MTDTKITEENFVDTKEYRDKAINRTEVLDKVKNLLLIPELESASMRMIADYYEVDIETIKKCYQHNCYEINADGVTFTKASKFSNLWKGIDFPTKDINKQRGHTEYKLSSNVVVDVPNAGLKLFSKRAVLRFGMLLRDSKIAKEVRTQLLNIFEHSTDTQKTQTIDEEKQLLIDISMAYASGDVNQLLSATMKYQNYKNRYTKQLEDENKNLETENALLAKKTLEWGNKPILNALVKKYALVCFSGKYQFPSAWAALYRQVKYKCHFDIPNRKGKGSMIDKIKDNEFSDVIKVAAGLCKANNIDVGKTINEINEKNIKSFE